MPRYRNTEPHPRQGLRGFLRWRTTRQRVTPMSFPLAPDGPAHMNAHGDRPTFTWIGHATCLVRVGGISILTDPQFSERASPVQWLGPRRLVPPGLPLAALPPIDLLLISHNHYDHLDRQSVRALARAPAPPRLCLVPLGLRRKVERWGLPNVVALDWWERHRAAELCVHSVPVQHSSVRTGLDRDKSRWTGWYVEHPALRFLFAGDTGYSRDFSEIRRRLGGPDVAALPIGAYEPRWFMRHVHATPEEAVQIHLDLGARRSLAMHWGTFLLTDEPLDEPPRRLAAARTAAGLPGDRFRVLRHGETVRL